MAEPKVNAELQLQYNQFKSTLTQISEKIGDIEAQVEEHKLVLDTLNGADPDRKCFRMVGGVLVEKKVKDVLPVLTTNEQGLETVLKNLAEDYKKTEKELDEWRKKNKVQIVKTQ
uniref:ARAD1C20416p n=1 Tax=Blastobotrys adeninivorans TaxID=409370 RepID=A0A060T1Y3_BLAAD